MKEGLWSGLRLHLHSRYVSKIATSIIIVIPILFTRLAHAYGMVVDGQYQVVISTDWGLAKTMWWDVWEAV